MKTKMISCSFVLALAMTVVAAETKTFSGSTSLDLADAGAASADNITISGSAQYGTVTNAEPLAVAGVNIYPNSTYELVDGTSLTLSDGMLVNGSSPLYPALFKQSGGTFSAGSGCLLNVFVSATSSNGQQGNESGYAEYLFSGGSATLNALYVASGISANTGKYPSPGVFTQTGGTFTAPTLGFGSKTQWNADGNYQTNAHAFVRLEGGTFSLGNGRIASHLWNLNESGEDFGFSTYKIQLAGGTLADSVSKSWTNAYQIEVSEGVGASTINWGENRFVQAAPLWGAGTLVKAGGGEMVLTDATRFTGTLDVEAGSVRVAGIPTDIYDTGCTIFTGDKAAAGLANGSSISSWADQSGSIVAQMPSEADLVTAPAWTNVVLNPTVAAGSFNGHAGIKFARSGTDVTGLAVPATSNPLAGATNFTAVVVFKKTSNGSGNTTSDYMYNYNEGILGSGIGYGSNGFGLSVNNSKYPVGGRAYKNGNASDDKDLFNAVAGRSGVCDGAVHVIAFSVDGAKAVMSCDGVTVSKTATGLKDGDFPFANNPFTIGLHSALVWKSGNSASPALAFDGEIAEIRLYKNRALGVGELNAVCAVLAEKYAGTSAAELAIARTECAEAAFTAAAAPSLPSGAIVFDADSVSGDDGDTVTSWTSEDSTVIATVDAGNGSAGPTLVHDAFGNAALRFDVDDKTALGIAAADCPITGKSDVTVAVVFRTTADGNAYTSDQANNNVLEAADGIVSTMDGAWNNSQDTAITFHKDGVVGVLAGQKYNGADCLLSAKPMRMNDGAAHIVVFSVDGTNAKMRRLVDGHFRESATTLSGVRASHNLKIGSLRSNLDAGYFTGDIAAVILWTRSLNAAEMFDVQEFYAKKFRVRPLARKAFALSEVADRGIGATNIHVAAGATFSVGLSSTSPFALSAGQTLSGAGDFNGSYRFGDGAVLDLGNVTVANVEDVQIADGAIVKIPLSALSAPVSMATASSVSGTVEIDMSALEGQMSKRWQGVMSFDPAAIDEGVAFAVTGLRGEHAVKVENGVVYVESGARGLAIFVR